MEINNPKQKRDKRARARAPVALCGFCFVFHAKSSNLFMGSAQFHVERILYWTQLLIAEQRPALCQRNCRTNNSIMKGGRFGADRVNES